jgi:ribonuclease R
VKELVSKKMDTQKEEDEIYCFSVDNKNTRAIDDAISIEDIDGSNFRIGIHIADLNEIVKTGGAMDREAQKKGKSYFIGKHFFKAMLPREIYANVGSLKQEEKRFVLSLYFVINKEGLIDYDSISYRHSIVKNQHKLSYTKVNEILSNPAKNSELDEVLTAKITTLNALMQNRSKFRQEVANPET